MNESSKKVASLLMVVTLGAGALAGCSSGSKPEESSTPPPAQSGSNPSAAASATPENSVRHTIRWSAFTGSYPLGEKAYGAQYLEEKFNIKFEVVRIDDPQQLNLLLTTGDAPDLFTTDSGNVRNYAENGIITEIPLDLIKKYMPNYYRIATAYDSKAFSYTSVNGKIYALPLFESTVSPVPIAIRADWLTNVGADIPTSLQDLENLFVKFRNNDPDRNGKKDTYGMSMASDTTTYWFQTIFGAFGTYPFIWEKSADNKLVYGFTQPKTKEALKLLRKWYSMELIDPEFVTDKRRTNGKDDLTYKFATGRIGYLDTLTYDDHQWDNDGHLNAKWVANSPEWQKFFSNPDNRYVTPAFTKIPTSGTQPVYVNVNPPVGPDGKSGTYRDKDLRSHTIVFGKDVAKNQDKLIRLMKILEADISDEETYINLEVGPEGKVWEWNDKKQRVLKQSWMESKDYHPQGRILGTGLFFDISFNMNPDFKTVFGGPRVEQRYKLTQELVSTKLPSFTNQLKAPLPSASKYNNELLAMLKEYMIKAILGEVDIDATYDATVKKWLDNGGNTLTDEANAWYKTTQ